MLSNNLVSAFVLHEKSGNDLTIAAKLAKTCAYSEYKTTFSD